MKVAKDNKTLELPMPGAKRGRGRPPTFSAMTNAERQKAYRDRMRAAGASRASRTATAGKFEMDSDEAEWERGRVAKIEDELSAAQTRIERLEKENALLIEERAMAFKVADLAKAELQTVTQKNGSTGKLASRVKELEAQLREINAEYNRATDQYADCVQIMKNQREAITTMSATIKRNASRKKKAPTVTPA